ncbi:MAG TPA: hypothetical protein VFO94_03970, partial [Gammaproteobacteria bacterium]|nr:hypothetical protein [Gammaproteobacteria bacterium]
MILGMDLAHEVLERRFVARRILLEDAVELVGPPALVRDEVPLPVADLRDALRLALAHVGERQRGLERSALRDVLQRAVHAHGP